MGLSRSRKVGLGLAGIGGLVAFTGVAVPLSLRGPAETVPAVYVDDAATPSQLPEEGDDKAPLLTVMTLNLAHGRGLSWHQGVLARKTIEKNLERIAVVLRREQPDIVALQEADGPSIWSGNFDHVRYLARNAGYEYCTRGEHVSGLGLHYGTAILSRIPLTEPLSVTFEPTLPTPSKGFLVASIRPQALPDLTLRVVSVHLDFARDGARRRQVAELARRLDKGAGPLIILGDFNCEWSGAESPLCQLAEGLELSTFQPLAREVVTFPGRKARLDWILASRDLYFVKHDVLRDTLSDHCAVIARLRLASEQCESLPSD
ncbi:endonuclease/exonuclease/phosphatase family protein [Planctomycetota bacterium]